MTENKARIQRRSPDPACLSALTGLDPLLARIYAARGVSDPSQLDLQARRLLPPQRLDGLDAAAQMLQQALRQGQRIVIVGDYDADGATGTALALRGLAALGFRQLDFLAPDRFLYGYGLSPAIVELALRNRPDLLITVDNGISSIDGVAAAKAAGLGVIVTDHHLPGAELPAADVLVNPNLPGSGFPSKAMAGVGVVFYLLLALRATLRESGWFGPNRPEPNLAELTDLVALGTVADVVPLDQNNRILVEQGLKRLRSGRGNPGIRALLSLAGRDPAQVTATDLGFAAGPRLNAAGRLDDMSLGIHCLLTDDLNRAMELARQLDQLNRERRGIEAEMQQEADLLLQRLFDHSDGWPQGVCLQGADWHQGVVGIVASRVKERLHRPVIAFAPVDDGSLKGSGRSIEGLHLRDALDAVACRHPQLIQRFGGHAMAAGLSIPASAYADFAAAFDAEVRRQLGDEPREPLIHSDGELAPAQFSLDTAWSLRQAGPWGQRFPEPLFDGRFRILQRRIVGEQHLKLRLRPEQGPELDAIAFFMAEHRDHPGDELHAAYRLDINHYRGEQNLQLQLVHIE
ncbi:single-stranded-DNA-specific exonuclease RecJ [Magnetovirga frankeli]|uniref:single-stranded-DNA-specific exonuclease RecJ n=1 Tax=Magnetovirga frankeli TaxID=947516 RepID=UPI003D349057